MVVTVGGRVELWQAVALDSIQRSGAGVVASRLDTQNRSSGVLLP